MGSDRALGDGATPPLLPLLDVEGPPKGLAVASAAAGVLGVLLGLLALTSTRAAAVPAYAVGVAAVLLATAYRFVVRRRQSRPRFLDHLPTNRLMLAGALLGFAGVVLASVELATVEPVVL